MSGLSNLPPQSNSILYIKEEMEIGETQLQEQIFHECEVKQSDADQSANFGKRSGIINGLCDDAEDAQPGLKDCEMKSGTIKEQLFEHNLSSKYAASSTQIPGRRRENNHTCSICAKKLRWRSELEAHMISHSGTRPYACTICAKRFATAGNLNRHKFTCGDDGKFRSRYKCTLCEKSFCGSNRLNSHMNIHRGERPFKCDICNKSFTSKSTLYSHNRTHSRDKKFECALCNKTFIFGRDRRRHEKMHSNGRLNYQCDMCKHYFRSDDQYRSHLEGNKCKGNLKESNMHTVHSTETRFQCSKCDHESFASIELLNRHKLQSHLPSKKTHSCSVCGKEYIYKFLLEIHMNSHTGSRPYTCTICPKSFSWPQNLRKHKLIHASLSTKAINRSRFKCTLCEKFLISRSSLNSHMNVHRGERPFKCKICPKTYTSAKTLLHHKNTHSNDRKYECTLCNKISNSGGDLRKHEKTHSNGRLNYQCDICKHYFRSDDQYRSHLEGNKCKGNLKESNMHTVHATEKSFQCSKCDGEPFASIDLLNRHKVQIHQLLKNNLPHSCTICPKSFSSPQSLHKHKITHDILTAEAKNRSRFKCTLCEKSFKSRVFLNSHMNFHRGKHPFKCKICCKSFMSRGLLSLHSKEHSKLKDMSYRCEHCNIYFKSEDIYRTHSENKCLGNSLDLQTARENERNQNEITDKKKIENIEPDEKAQNADAFEKKYKCDECNKKFICKRNLNFHMRSHAKISST